MDFNNALLDFVEVQLDSPFTSNIYLGEMVRNQEGCYAVAYSSQQPDMYTGVQYRNLTFWSLTAETDSGYAMLEYLYELFHQRANYEIDDWHIFFSHATSTIDDMDRNGEGYKMWRLDFRFISGRLNSSSS